MLYWLLAVCIRFLLLNKVYEFSSATRYRKEGIWCKWDVVELLADRFISVYLVGNFGLMSYGICESCAYKAF